MHTLIAVQLSTYQRLRSLCETTKKQASDGGRDAAPQIVRRIHMFNAPAAAEKHLETCFRHAKFSTIVRWDLARKALSLEVVELLLRGKMPMYRAHAETLRIAANGAKLAKRLLAVGICLYYARTAGWPHEAPPAGGFNPLEAYGYLSEAHKTYLYGDPPSDPPRFTQAVEARLGTLYASLDTPAPGKLWFPDQEVQDEVTGKRINQSQANFLQSFPRMDHSRERDRSECEQEIREQVKARIKSVTGRRWRLGNYLDELIADIRTNFYIENSCTDGLITAFRAGIAGEQIQSDVQRMRGDPPHNEPWREVFPDCVPDGTFEDLAFNLTENLKREDGRQHAWHYLEWRKQKEGFMYDYYMRSTGDSPVFTSLSQDVNLPLPNKTYGHHLIVWKQDALCRAVFTLGDYGRPRRSVLLLLRDLLYPIGRKDGQQIESAKRVYTVANIFYRSARKKQRRTFTNGHYQTTLGEEAVRKDNEANIECHVFGSLNINEHAKVIVIATSAAAPARPRLGFPAITGAELDAHLPQPVDPGDWELIKYDSTLWHTRQFKNAPLAGVQKLQSSIDKLKQGLE